MMHALLTKDACNKAEGRVRRVLSDAIRRHSPVLQDDYRQQLTEIDAARSWIPKRYEP